MARYLYRIRNGQFVHELYIRRICETEGSRMWWHLMKGYPL